MKYDCKYWKHRNDKLHDEAFQRKRVMCWKKKEHARALEGQHLRVRKFAI